MTQTTCDMCSEPVGRSSVGISLHKTFERFDLSDFCAQPVVKFLLKSGAVEDNSKSYVFVNQKEAVS